MSDLNEILTESINGFDEEPSAGHFERFNEKLLRQNRKIRLNSSLLKVAAAIVFAMLSANLFIYLKVQRTENQLSSDQNKEIREAGFYYTSQINSDLSDIEKMAKEGIGSEKEVLQVKKELSEMDSLYQNLEKDYQSNPKDERVINAVIEYYQAKLEIVNTIKSDLEKAKQIKFIYHENAKI